MCPAGFAGKFEFLLAGQDGGALRMVFLGGDDVGLVQLEQAVQFGLLIRGGGQGRRDQRLVSGGGGRSRSQGAGELLPEPRSRIIAGAGAGGGVVATVGAGVAGAGSGLAISSWRA